MPYTQKTFSTYLLIELELKLERKHSFSEPPLLLRCTAANSHLKGFTEFP